MQTRVTCVELAITGAGVDGLSRKIQDVKDFVDERVEALSRKQDDLAESQEEMKDLLGDVQNNIQGVSAACHRHCIMSSTHCISHVYILPLCATCFPPSNTAVSVQSVLTIYSLAEAYKPYQLMSSCKPTQVFPE